MKSCRLWGVHRRVLVAAVASSPLCVSEAYVHATQSSNSDTEKSTFPWKAIFSVGGVIVAVPLVATILRNFGCEKATQAVNTDEQLRATAGKIVLLYTDLMYGSPQEVLSRIQNESDDMKELKSEMERLIEEQGTEFEAAPNKPEVKDLNQKYLVAATKQLDHEVRNQLEPHINDLWTGVTQHSNIFGSRECFKVVNLLLEGIQLNAAVYAHLITNHIVETDFVDLKNAYEMHGGVMSDNMDAALHAAVEANTFFEVNKYFLMSFLQDFLDHHNSMTVQQRDKTFGPGSQWWSFLCGGEVLSESDISKAEFKMNLTKLLYSRCSVQAMENKTVSYQKYWIQHLHPMDGKSVLDGELGLQQIVKRKQKALEKFKTELVHLHETINQSD